MTERKKTMREINAVNIIFIVAFCGIVSFLLSSCSFKIEAGYHGETGVSDTVVSKEFVEKPLPVTARRY